MEVEAMAGLAVRPPSEQQWAQQAERQRRELGGTVDQVFSAQNMGEGVRRLHQKRNDELRRMSHMSYNAASVVNLMPFPLNVNGVLHSRLAGKDGNQVPECPVGENYVHKVIAEPQWSIRDDGAAMDNVDNYNPVPHAPMDLADDYVKEFVGRMGMGGVIVYEGKERPDTAELQQKLQEARKARNRWLLRKVQEAEAEWSDTSGRGRKNITELHRRAAEVLLHEKILKAQPSWLLVTNAEPGEAPDPCLGCGIVAEHRGSMCKSCGYVYKPLEAYKAGLITYNHFSMDRLTGDEWKIANEIKAKREEEWKKGGGGKK